MRGVMTFGAWLLLATGLWYPVPIEGSHPQQQAPQRARSVRLKPSAFPSLPQVIRLDLEKRGCTVPQSDVQQPGPPHNVIRGHFTTSKAIDVAVLCWRGGESTILVYRSSTTKAVVELERAKDDIYLQGDGEGGQLYSRSISTASPSVILAYYKAFGGETPPSPLDHDGINSSFDDKASTVLYWFGGKWLELAGMNSPVPTGVVRPRRPVR